MKQVSPHKLIEWFKECPQEIEIIDVRESYEYYPLHLINSKCIPLDDLTYSLHKISRREKIIFVSSTGRESREAIKIIQESKEGRLNNLYNLKNGLEGILDHPLGSLVLTSSPIYAYPKILK